MTIEATLSSIDATLKALLQMATTGVAAAAEFGEASAPQTTAAPAAKTRTKKADAATAGFKLLDGDAEGTRYFTIDKHNSVARIAPGETIPSIEGMQEVDGDQYAAKKEQFAKKSLTAEPTTANAAASTPAATASPASSSGESVSFQTVVEKLMELSKDTRPGKGREAIQAFVTKHGVKRVPELQALNKSAELLAEVEALLAPDAVEDDVFA